MSKKLSPAEKKIIEDYARSKADPGMGAIVAITVDDELDENGRASFKVHYLSEKVMPPEFDPRKG